MFKRMPKGGNEIAGLQERKGREGKEMSKCLGGECIYGIELCCRDCTKKEKCVEICDGEEGKGCNGDCEDRDEN